MSAIGDRVKGVVAGGASVISELVRLMPDGFIIGSGIFALLTLSFPYLVFFASQLEAIGIFFGIRAISSAIGIFKDPVSATKAMQSHCKTGFRRSDLESLSMFSAVSKSPFPSAPIFSMAFACLYVFMTMNAQMAELTAMGKEFSSRFYISLFSLTGLLLVYFLFRLKSGCESFGNLFVSLLLGGILGMMIVSQNQLLFGAQSTNLLGIPLLRGRAANGAPLYICPTQKA